MIPTRFKAADLPKAFRKVIGFTLVELIVVITILAILGAIGFLSVNGYSSRARDSSRVADISLVAKSLDLSIITVGNYPLPDGAFFLTYSGGVVWNQGTVGSNVEQKLHTSISGGGLGSKPVDPLKKTEYTYSSLAFGNAYQLKAEYEGDDLVVASSITETAYAAPWAPTIAYVRGNYGGLVAKTITGGLTYVIATPSIITNSGTTAGGSIELKNGTLSGTLVFNGKNLTTASSYNPGATTALIFSGATLPASDSAGWITNMVTALKASYSGSDLTSIPVISGLLSTPAGSTVSLGNTLLVNQLGSTVNAAPTETVYAIGPVANMSVGAAHSCVVTTAWALKCWGNNGNGQIGDNSTANRPSPTDVVGLSSGVAAVAAANTHTCALMTNGSVKCWGYNGNGSLGDGTTNSSYIPVNVSGLSSGVVKIAAADGHTCVIMNTGGMKCWGNNGSGQVGDGTTTARTTPTDVSGLSSGVVAMSMATSRSCALTSGWGMKCWGGNSQGHLGDGTTTNRFVPTDVSWLTSGVASIGQSCAITTAGAAKCWGYNGYGQIGDGTSTQSLTPVNVSGMSSGVASISSGWSHVCARMSDGTAKCWWQGASGQIGDASANTSNRLTATNVSGLASGIVSIGVGLDHSCALITGWVMKCWGYNGLGRIGDGTTTSRTSPVDVVFP